MTQTLARREPTKILPRLPLEVVAEATKVLMQVIIDGFEESGREPDEDTSEEIHAAVSDLLARLGWDEHEAAQESARAMIGKLAEQAGGEIDPDGDGGFVVRLPGDGTVSALAQLGSSDRGEARGRRSVEGPKGSTDDRNTGQYL